MAISHKPEGYPCVVPYLIVDGAGALMTFLKAAFDAEELMCMRNETGIIQHAAVRVGDSVIEFANATGEWKAIPGAIHLYVPDADATYEKAINAGGESVYALADMFYGERSGGVKDPCGNHWYIATVTENLSNEEMADRAKAAGKV